VEERELISINVGEEGTHDRSVESHHKNESLVEKVNKRGKRSQLR